MTDAGPSGRPFTVTELLAQAERSTFAAYGAGAGKQAVEQLIQLSELNASVGQLQKAVELAEGAHRNATSAGFAALRRQVTALERQLALVRRRGAVSAPPTTSESPQKIRFVAKGLKSQRARLGLSAADFGRLVGVSAQSIYNWEQGHATPRASQLAVLASRRGLGKREAQALLAQQSPKKGRRAQRKR